MKILDRFFLALKRGIENAEARRNIRINNNRLRTSRKFKDLNIKYIGSKEVPDIEIGANTSLKCTVNIGDGVLKIGDFVSIRSGSFISCKKRVVIGNNVFTAKDVFITDNNNHPTGARERLKMTLSNPGSREWKFLGDDIECDEVIIENNVWLGQGAVILKGVTIGEGSIVAIGAVVTKSIPKYSIVAGNPARVVKSLNTEGYNSNYIL